MAVNRLTRNAMLVLLLPMVMMSATAASGTSPATTHNHRTNASPPWTHRNDLASLLNMRGGGINTVVIIPVTGLSGFWAMTCNAINGWRKLQVDNWIIAAEDENVLEVCRLYGYPCYNSTWTIHGVNYESDESTRANQKGFSIVSWVKPKLIFETIKLNYSVLMMDTDISIISNPLPHLLGRDVALQVAADNDLSPERANSGFVFVRPSESTVQLYQRIIHTIETTNCSDQAALQQELPMFYRSLPHDDMGKFLLILRRSEGFQMKCHWDASSVSLIAHANCMTGFHNKLNWLRHGGPKTFHMSDCAIESLNATDLNVPLARALQLRTDTKRYTFESLAACRCM